MFLFWLLRLNFKVWMDVRNLEDAKITYAFNSVFLLYYALFKGLMLACHQHVFNVADYG